MKCIYPYCKEDATKPTNLKIGIIVENGIKLTNDRKEVNLCKYHSLLAEEGIIGIVNQEGIIQLSGPFEIIEVLDKILKIKESLK